MNKKLICFLLCVIMLFNITGSVYADDFWGGFKNIFSSPHGEGLFEAISQIGDPHNATGAVTILQATLFIENLPVNGRKRVPGPNSLTSKVNNLVKSVEKAERNVQSFIDVITDPLSLLPQEWLFNDNDESNLSKSQNIENVEYNISGTATDFSESKGESFIQIINRKKKENGINEDLLLKKIGIVNAKLEDSPELMEVVNSLRSEDTIFEKRIELISENFEIIDVFMDEVYIVLGNVARIKPGKSIEAKNTASSTPGNMDIFAYFPNDDYLLDVAVYDELGNETMVYRNVGKRTHISCPPNHRMIVTNKMDREIAIVGKVIEMVEGKASYIKTYFNPEKQENIAVNEYVLTKGDKLSFKSDKFVLIKYEGNITINGFESNTNTYKTRNIRANELIEIVALDNEVVVYGGSEIFNPSINGLLSNDNRETSKKEIVQAMQTSSRILVDGVTVDFDAYNIDGNNYFKLRDLAAALNTTEKKFGVRWDGEKNAIDLVSGEEYILVGGELTKGDGLTKEALTTSSNIYIDGKLSYITGYTISNNNYFKLRDIGEKFDFGVFWDNETKTIIVDTSTKYFD